MFTNKHVIVAMLVAPILAIIAWFAVDRVVGEEPQPAVEGQSYPLVAKPGCRYAGGECELVNGDFRLAVSVDSVGDLRVSASHALDDLRIAVGGADEFGEPLAMRSDDAGRQQFRVSVGRLPADAQLRLLASAGGSQYFAEMSLAFTAERSND